MDSYLRDSKWVFDSQGEFMMLQREHGDHMLFRLLLRRVKSLTLELELVLKLRL